MDWSKFEPTDFEYGFERDELFAHRITLQVRIFNLYFGCAAEVRNGFDFPL